MQLQNKIYCLLAKAMRDFVWKIKLYLQKHEWKTLALERVIKQDILFACESNDGFCLEDKIIFTKARVENTRAR